MLQVGLTRHHRSRYARATRGLLVFLALATTALATAPAAMAWKPFAHNYIGYQAYNDAVAGCTNQSPCQGSVKIGNDRYPINPVLADALYKEPAYYNAGVVGPDGFPDLAFGQSVIHPEHTGAWLQYIYNAAWAAPNARDAHGKLLYTALEDKQILAFTYGFLTHAAGDMWGHTLINDFAGGLFPSVGEVTKSRDAALIALRHIVAEGYAGSATPGWDRTIGTRAKVCVGAPTTRGTNCKDVSDDQTGAVQLAAPHKFLYNIFVSPDAKLPVPSRGPLLDFFFDKQAKVKVDAARLQLDANNHDCKHPAPNCEGTTIRQQVSTLRGVKRIALTVWKCKPTPDKPKAECARDSRDEKKDGDNTEVRGRISARGATTSSPDCPTRPVQPPDRPGAVRSADPARRAERQVRQSRRRRAVEVQRLGLAAPGQGVAPRL